MKSLDFALFWGGRLGELRKKIDVILCVCCCWLFFVLRYEEGKMNSKRESSCNIMNASIKFSQDYDSRRETVWWKRSLVVVGRREELPRMAAAATGDIKVGTTEIRDLTRIERIGAHSHIRGKSENVVCNSGWNAFVAISMTPHFHFLFVIRFLSTSSWNYWILHSTHLILHFFLAYSQILVSHVYCRIGSGRCFGAKRSESRFGRASPSQKGCRRYIQNDSRRENRW